jgi:hypothetical protein
MSFGQRYQVEAAPEPEPQVLDVEPDPGVVLVPPIVLESVRVPVILEVDPLSVRQAAELIGAIIREAVAAAIVAGFEDASVVEPVDEPVDDGEPSSDRAA